MEQSEKITELEESGNASINLNKLFPDMSRKFLKHYVHCPVQHFLDDFFGWVTCICLVTALRRSRKKCQTLRKQERRFLESVISNCKGMMRLNKTYPIHS
jgi:hypothetical protein